MRRAIRPELKVLLDSSPSDGLLINAIKEQQAQIERQQKQLGELKAVTTENAELKAQLAAILTRLARLEQAA